MKKILIVDNSLFMRTWLKKLLSEANFSNFVEAENGLKAIDQYKLYSPDIVIMDITMPELNGIDALKEIMKIDRHANVIICSALGQKHLIIDAIKNGAKDFIIKPNFDDLIEIVNNVLST